MLSRYLQIAVLCIALSACSIPLDEGLFWVPEDLTLDERMEGETGLFMGLALQEPITRTLTHREYWTTKIEYRLTPEQFIPAQFSRERVAFASGELEVIRVDAEKEATDQTPLIVHCYGIGASLYNNGIQYTLKVLPFGDTIAFDLPAHGKSDGEASIEDFKAANLAMLEYVTDNAGDRPVIFWGHSLGGFVCADLARRAQRVDGVVIEAAALNGKVVAQKWIPFMFRPFLRVHPNDEIADFDMLKLLDGVDAPILLMGGKRDKIIKESLVRALAQTLEKHGFDVQYQAFSGAGHSTIAFAPGFDDTVRGFLDKISGVTLPDRR